MKVLAAYLTVIAIWSTTPLAIKWSGEGPGFLLGVTARMTLGGALVVCFLALSGRPIPWRGPAPAAYLAVAVHIYGAMLAAYWAAQWIPSGWMSVVFGLTPVLTALLSSLWLRGQSSSPRQWFAYGAGLAGLAVMSGSALEYSPQALAGIAGVLAAAFLQALSAVWVKRVDSGLPPLTLLGGGLIVSVAAYLPTWYWLDGTWPPPELPAPALASILYLGLVATTIGFALYYYVLSRLTATRVSLITLVTPVSALLLGHWINGEPLTPRVLSGTACILLAVLVHESVPVKRSRRQSG
ncbi:MAG: DMT family transporter [Methylococcaceae bacterium]|nr:DMT family transporter [Methylococcaceae bacterium]